MPQIVRPFSLKKKLKNSFIQSGHGSNLGYKVKWMRNKSQCTNSSFWNHHIKHWFGIEPKDFYRSAFALSQYINKNHHPIQRKKVLRNAQVMALGGKENYGILHRLGIDLF